MCIAGRAETCYIELLYALCDERHNYACVWLLIQVELSRAFTQPEASYINALCLERRQCTFCECEYQNCNVVFLKHVVC